MDATYSFLRMQYSSHGQEAESLSSAWLSPILDPVGIFNRTAKHLKAAADTDEGNAGFTEPAKLPGKTSTVEPFQIVKGLLAPGQHQYIGNRHFLGLLDKS